MMTEEEIERYEKLLTITSTDGEIRVEPIDDSLEAKEAMRVVMMEFFRRMKKAQLEVDDDGDLDDE